MVMVVDDRAVPVIRRTSNKPCLKAETPGGRPKLVGTGTKPAELAVSITQLLVVAICARPGPVPVAVDWLGAVQLASVWPVPVPVQVQAQGEPWVTVLAVPCVHKPLVGTKAVAAITPQAPLAAPMVMLTVAVAAV